MVATAVFYSFSIFILIPTTAVVANENNNSSSNDNFTDEVVDIPQDFIPVTESTEFSIGGSIEYDDTTVSVAKETLNDTTSDGVNENENDKKGM